MTSSDYEALMKHWTIIPTGRVWVWNSTLPVAEQKELRLFPEVQPTKARDMRIWESETIRFEAVLGRNSGKEPADSERYWTWGGPYTSPSRIHAVLLDFCGCGKKDSSVYNDGDFVGVDG
jgi:hypothetical protein